MDIKSLKAIGLHGASLAELEPVSRGRSRVKSSLVSQTMNSKQIIEIGLGSIGKIKIMKALAEENKLATIYVLHKKTHLKREDIKNNISDLVKIGWVTHNKYARM